VEMVGLLPAGGAAETWMSLRPARADGLPARMVEAGELALVRVQGVRTPFYARSDAEKAPLDDQVRFIARWTPSRGAGTRWPSCGGSPTPRRCTRSLSRGPMNTTCSQSSIAIGSWRGSMAATTRRRKPCTPLGYWKETRRSARRWGGSSAASGGGRSPRPHVRSLVEISEGALQGWRMQLPFRRSCRSPRLRRGAPNR